jgi:hypothetical protein
MRVQIDQAERAYDLNKAAQLKYGSLEALQRDREAQEAQLLEIQAQGTTLLREQVTRGGHRRNCGQVDGHSHQPADGIGAAKAAAARRTSA